MTPQILLETLSGLGVRLWVEGENLRFAAPINVLSLELRKELAAHKVALMAHLGGGDPDPSVKPATLQHPPRSTEPKGSPPEIPGRIKDLDGEALFDLAHDVRIGEEERAVCRTELLVRADAMIAEIEGRRPPPNQSLHDMFREAHIRFGSRDLEERSITAWIRRHASAVGALWPEAPLDASWFAWRCHVGREHLDVLDSAFKAVTANSINLTGGIGHE